MKPPAAWTAIRTPRVARECATSSRLSAEVPRGPHAGFSGISDCEVLEVDPLRHLVYTWTPVPKRPDQPRPAPMTLTWTLRETNGGTQLVLEQIGLESLSLWYRFSMNVGWSRMLKKLMPKVLTHVRGAVFTPGAVTRRDYDTKTVRVR